MLQSFDNIPATFALFENAPQMCVHLFRQTEEKENVFLSHFLIEHRMKDVSVIFIFICKWSL